VKREATLLIVDDEAEVREVLVEYFAAQGYATLGAGNAAAARASAAARGIDLALVDVHMPGEDGLSLARHLRERYAGIAIVMLTSASAVVDRVVGLEMGADDYVAKPFDPRELRARVKSVLRRLEGKMDRKAVAETVAIGACRLNLRSRQLADAKGREVPLTAMEFALLKTFLDHPNQVLSRDRLLTLTRNREWEPFDRSIDIRIARLRRKVEEDPDRPRSIRTVRGAGYMYVPGGEK